MRSIIFVALFPITFAGLLYVFAMAPATSVIETIGARIGAQQVAQHSGPCFSDSAAKHFGVSPRANAQNCALQQISQ